VNLSRVERLTLPTKVGMVTKTAARILDDLALLHIVERSKKTDADNSPNCGRQLNGCASTGPKE